MGRCYLKVSWGRVAFLFFLLALRIRRFACILCLIWGGAKSLNAQSNVYWSENRLNVEGLRISEDGVSRQWREALEGFTGALGAAAAWRKLGIEATDHVGIKVSTTGGRLSGTRMELVNAVIASLKSAGVIRITVWDKWRREMEVAGYLPSSGQIHSRVLAILPAPPGMSPRHFLDYPLVGKLLPGDIDFLTEFERDRLRSSKKEDRKRFLDLKSGTSRRSYFAKPLVDDFTKIINIASMTDHPIYGIHGCMVSLALGSVDNTLRFIQSNRAADEAIGEILDHPLLRSKVVLHVMDALRVQYASGPRQEAEFIRPAGILLLSKDPVAIDRLGVEVIDQYRKKAGIPAVEAMAGHIGASAEIGLGEGQRDKIQVRK
jgi:hypothetical protein